MPLSSLRVDRGAAKGLEKKESENRDGFGQAEAGRAGRADGWSLKVQSGCLGKNQSHLGGGRRTACAVSERDLTEQAEQGKNYVFLRGPRSKLYFGEFIPAAYAPFWIKASWMRWLSQ